MLKNFNNFFIYIIMSQNLIFTDKYFNASLWEMSNVLFYALVLKKTYSL